MKLIFSALILGASFLSSAEAATQTIGTSNDGRGWWANHRTNPAGNDYYFTGPYGSGDANSYFTFDLSGVSGTVTDLTLTMHRGGQPATVTLEFFDVDTSATDLAQREILDTAIYADLGTGVSYGSFEVGTGATGDILSFVLGDAAIADANAAIGGAFSIGGSAEGGYIFGGSGGDVYQVELMVTTSDSIAPVPLPAGVILLGTGLGVLRTVRRRA